MYELTEAEWPATSPALCAATERLNFDMPSDARTGALLRTLAASKPGGRLLELGTGTGLATAWLLDGMDAAARLVTVDHDERVQSVAREMLGHDARIEFVLDDGVRFLHRQSAMKCRLSVKARAAGSHLMCRQAICSTSAGCTPHPASLSP